MSDCLSEDLINEIFSRLPLKSLVRFRSLSKFLCWYITSPCLIRKHTLRAPKKFLIRHETHYKDSRDDQDFCTLHIDDELPLFLKRGYTGIKAAPFPFKRDFCIVGSCNGILCLFEYELRSFNLWNPSIGRKLTVPDCPQGFYFDMEIGFGFDPITDDYKIVIISNPLPQINGGIVECIYVYAMKTRAWCAIAPPTLLFDVVTSNACFVNGALHWVVEYYKGDLNDKERRYILTFDVSTNVFGKIELPQFRWTTKQLTTIQGSLTVISRYMWGIYIWVRRDASWFLVFGSQRDKVPGKLQRLLQPTNNGDLLYKNVVGEAHVYYPKIGAQSRLLNFNSSSSICEVELFVESLELLDLGTSC